MEANRTQTEEPIENIPCIETEKISHEELERRILRFLYFYHIIKLSDIRLLAPDEPANRIQRCRKRLIEQGYVKDVIVTRKFEHMAEQHYTATVMTIRGLNHLYEIKSDYYRANSAARRNTAPPTEEAKFIQIPRSQSAALALGAELYVLPFEKPHLVSYIKQTQNNRPPYRLDRDEPDNYGMYLNTEGNKKLLSELLEQGIFYTPSEVRQAVRYFTDMDNQICGGRFSGIIITTRRVFILYNAGNAQVKLYKTSEDLFLDAIVNLFALRYRSSITGIMTSNRPDLLSTLVTGYRRAVVADGRISNGVVRQNSFHLLNGTSKLYQAIYYCTNTPEDCYTLYDIVNEYDNKSAITVADNFFNSEKAREVGFEPVFGNDEILRGKCTCNNLVRSVAYIPVPEILSLNFYWQKNTSQLVLITRKEYIDALSRVFGERLVKAYSLPDLKEESFVPYTKKGLPAVEELRGPYSPTPSSAEKTNEDKPSKFIKRHISLPADINETVKQLAADENKAFSAMCRELIECGLRYHEENHPGKFSDKSPTPTSKRKN